MAEFAASAARYGWNGLVAAGPDAWRVVALAARMCGAGVDQVPSTPLMVADGDAPLAAVCLGLDGLPVRAYADVYQGVREACVYPAGDAQVEQLVADADVAEGARAIGLTLGVPSVAHLGWVDGLLLDRAFDARRHHQAVTLATVTDLADFAGTTPTAHDARAATAAAALARAAGVDPDAVAHALRQGPVQS